MVNRSHITDVFSQPPARFQFQEAKSGDGPRLLGASVGAALQLDGPPDDIAAATLSVVVPPDDLAMARHNGTILMLLMVAFAPKWDAGHTWLTDCLRNAANDIRVDHEYPNRHDGWRYTLRTNRARSLATLIVTKEPAANVPPRA